VEKSPALYWDRGGEGDRGESAGIEFTLVVDIMGLLGFGIGCWLDAASDRLNDWLSRAKLFIIRRVKSGLSNHPFDLRWLVCLSV
jgi:hypothetical protein